MGFHTSIHCHVIVITTYGTPRHCLYLGLALLRRTRPLEYFECLSPTLLGQYWLMKQNMKGTWPMAYKKLEWATRKAADRITGCLWAQIGLFDVFPSWTEMGIWEAVSSQYPWQNCWIKVTKVSDPMLNPHDPNDPWQTGAAQIQFLLLKSLCLL